MPILTIELPSGLHDALEQEANTRGVSLPTYLVTLLKQRGEGTSLAAVDETDHPDEDLEAMLNRWDAEDAARGGEPVPPPVIPPLALREVKLG